MSGRSLRSSLKNLFHRNEDGDEEPQDTAYGRTTAQHVPSRQLNGASNSHGQYSHAVVEPKTPPRQRTEEGYPVNAGRTTATSFTAVGEDSPSSMPEVLADDLSRIPQADSDPYHTRNFSYPQVVDYSDAQTLDRASQDTSVRQAAPAPRAMPQARSPPTLGSGSVLNRPRPVSQGDNMQFSAHRNNPTFVVPDRRASLTASSKPLPEPPVAIPLRHERRSIDQGSVNRPSFDSQHQDGRPSMDRSSDRRSSVDKPLPSVPPHTSPAFPNSSGITHEGVGSGGNVDAGASRKAVAAELKRAGLENQINLSNTVDTVVHERVAPAVVHETVRVDTHHILEEVTTREFHNHHYYHRILPIVDVDVLPARHFVLVEGGYTEISEKEVPGRAVAQLNQHMQDMALAMTPQSKPLREPRTFTARAFNGREDDYKETRAPEGHTRTETTWVHPPVEEDGGKLSGQTLPFYLGSPNPAENGLHAQLPPGNIVGESAVLEDEQRRNSVGQVKEHHGIRRKSTHGGGGGGGGGTETPMQEFYAANEHAAV